MKTPLNVALIGPGRMGVKYARVIQDNPAANLVAICGNTPETTRKNGASFGVPLYNNNRWEDMFSDHPHIDTVIIATSEWAHLDPFLAAASRNCHIIIEKPLATSMDDLEKMMAAAEHMTSQVLVCLTCRFDLRYRAAFEKVSGGDVGQIGYIYSRRNATHGIANRVTGKMPMPYWILGHDIDLLRWFTGSEVTQVYAVQSELNAPGNFLHVSLEFKDGARGLIENSWFTPSGGQDYARFDVEGVSGKVEVDLSDRTVRLTGAEGESEIPDLTEFTDFRGALRGATPDMINHFISVIEGEAEPWVRFEDAVAVQRICKWVQESIEQKQPIKV